MTHSGERSDLMRAVRLHELIGPEGLRLDRLPEPESAGRVGIAVVEAGVSFPDLLLSYGRYQRKPETPFIPGVEVSGYVISVPPGCDLQMGQAVAAFVGFGGWAEYVTADPLRTFPMPEGVSFREAAGLPMNYLTAHLAVARRGALTHEETLVVHGAAGGLGTATIHLGRAIGARVLAVASTPEKQAIAARAGAHHVVSVEGWGNAVMDITHGKGAHVVADIVGGERTMDSIRVLRPGGRLLVMGFASGDIPHIPANRLLLGNIDAMGIAWGPFVDVNPEYALEQWNELTALLSSRGYHPVVGRRFPLANAREALSCLEDRDATGKVTLSVRNTPDELSMATRGGIRHPGGSRNG